MANATYIVAFGAVGDRPIAGDWDGDGKDSLGVYRPSTGVVYLRNALTGGTPTTASPTVQTADTPLAGDWNLDAFSAGMYRNSDRSFHVSNRNVTATVADDGVYALGNTGDLPVVGDWTHAGYSGIGAYRHPREPFLLSSTPSTPLRWTSPSFDGDLVFRDGFDPAGVATSRWPARGTARVSAGTLRPSRYTARHAGRSPPPAQPDPGAKSVDARRLKISRPQGHAGSESGSGHQ